MYASSDVLLGEAGEEGGCASGGTDGAAGWGEGGAGGAVDCPFG